MVDDDFWAEVEAEIQTVLARNGIFRRDTLPYELREIIEDFMTEVRIFVFEQDHGKFGRRGQN